MTEARSASVEELVDALKKQGGRLPFEIGAFVALEVCEQLMEGPAAVSPREVRVTSEGAIRVQPSSGATSEQVAARSVVDVLAHLLAAAGQGVPPQLLELVEHGFQRDGSELSRLRDELEATLVPLNRGAARRVLSRTLRDTSRADGGRRSSRPPPRQPEEESAGDADAELDALLSEGQAQGAQEEVPTARREVPPEVRRQAAGGERPPARPERRDSEQPLQAVGSSAGGGGVAEDDLAAAAPSRPVRQPDFEDLEGSPQPRARRGRGWAWALAIVVLLVVAGVGVFLFQKELARRIVGPPAQTTASSAASNRSSPSAGAGRNATEQAPHGTLILRTKPENAQVLLFVGRGPAVADHLPVGVAHEFVAIADGKRPTRALVPKNAKWARKNGGALYELAMQAGSQPMKRQELTLGRSRLPARPGSPEDELGRVRVVTNPPGAKVYRFLGWGPKVEVERLAVDRGHELLVTHQGHRPKRVRVAPSQWSERATGPVAEMRVTLEARGPKHETK